LTPGVNLSVIIVRLLLGTIWFSPTSGSSGVLWKIWPYHGENKLHFNKFDEMMMMMMMSALYKTNMLS
jgi:hypothetical protein